MGERWQFMGTQTLTEYVFKLRWCFAENQLRFDDLMLDGEPANDEDLTTSQYLEILRHLKQYRYETL